MYMFRKWNYYIQSCVLWPEFSFIVLFSSFTLIWLVAHIQSGETCFLSDLLTYSSLRHFLCDFDRSIHSLPDKYGQCSHRAVELYKHNPDQYPDNAHIVAGGFNRASLNAVNFHLHITGSKRAERAVTAAILNPRTATRSNPSLHQASRHFLASKLQTVEAGTPANVSCETLVNPTLGHASGHIGWRRCDVFILTVSACLRKRWFGREDYSRG